MIALRIDILSRVLRETPSAGFQEEKYRSLYLHIRWTRSQLENLLAKRVAFLFKRKYTRDNVTLGDIIPNIQINKRTAITYMLDRTFSRPREAILFVNQCISLAEGSSKITAQIIRKAEVSYSQQRLHSLFDEWRREYPNLDAAVEILRASRTKVELRNLNTDACDKSAEELTKANRSDDALRRSAQRLYLDQSYERINFLSEVIMILYQVGAVGIQLAPHSERSWSFEVTNLPLATKLKPESEVSIHKTFWSALGVIHREKGDDVD